MRPPQERVHLVSTSEARPPGEETQIRLHAAARWLTDAASGRASLIDATDAARRLIDRALDAETNTLDHIESETQ